jgi:hypothetical protein
LESSLPGSAAAILKENVMELDEEKTGKIAIAIFLQRIREEGYIRSVGVPPEVTHEEFMAFCQKMTGQILKETHASPRKKRA